VGWARKNWLALDIQVLSNTSPRANGTEKQNKLETSFACFA
jgi:hypothetical protein